MKEVIEKAYANRVVDVNQFVWKGRKIKTANGMAQEEIRLVDASEIALNEYYAHCMSMLHNTDRNNPGRYVVLNIIKDQRERCNCELFLR